MGFWRSILPALTVWCAAAMATAGMPLIDGGARRALIGTDGSPAAAGGASLFAGRAAAGLFAPSRARPDVLDDRARDVSGRGSTGPAARLRHLIARAEAGPDGYDAVQHGARRRPARRPTEMTLAEIDRWIDATPGQPHAIGRYQFIPATLRRLVTRLGLPGTARFSPALQDRLADVLLDEAGLAEARSGRLSRQRFMHNLARIWAGLPTATGRSHYHGHAGNRATMTWARFEAEMRDILPG